MNEPNTTAVKKKNKFAEVWKRLCKNPGAVIGRGAQVYPLVSVRGTVPANCIHKGGSVVEKR